MKSKNKTTDKKVSPMMRVVLILVPIQIVTLFAVIALLNYLDLKYGIKTNKRTITTVVTGIFLFIGLRMFNKEQYGKE
ncbi:MAG: hypothetical protein Q7S13_02920 [Candidatus Omnitrophota bacterium]|nr:hypothetical protein [Candidatus Omnitrophota bacterium]